MRSHLATQVLLHRRLVQPSLVSRTSPARSSISSSVFEFLSPRCPRAASSHRGTADGECHPPHRASPSSAPLAPQVADVAADVADAVVLASSRLSLSLRSSSGAPAEPPARVSGRCRVPFSGIGRRC